MLTMLSMEELPVAHHQLVDPVYILQTMFSTEQLPIAHQQLVDTVYKEIRILDTVKVQESAKCKGTNAVNWSDEDQSCNVQKAAEKSINWKSFANVNKPTL